MATDEKPAGWTKDLPDHEPVGFTGIADMAGIKLSSARAYHSIAKYRRKQAAKTGQSGIVRPGDLPEPDAHYGQSPVWRVETVKRWMENRPGQGVYVGKHGRQKVVQ